MMLRNNKLPPDITKNANQKYLSKRKDVIKVIKSTSLKLQFRSPTFYFALYCMDLIFCKDNTLQKLSDFVLVGLSCLAISAKINENDPNVPEMKKFLNVLSNISRFRYRYSIDELNQSEINCLELLQYRITYYPIYNFLVFFFGHGIFLNNFKVNKCDPKEQIKSKILEKIYVLSREMLDWLLEEDILILGNDCSIAAAIILRKAMEMVFGSYKTVDVFLSAYQIDDKKENYIKIDQMLSTLLQKKNKKKETSSSNKPNSSNNDDCENTFNKPVMKESMMSVALKNLGNVEAIDKVIENIGQSENENETNEVETVEQK